MRDYTVIGKAIAKTMEIANEPLSENQYLLLQGTIGAYLINIEKLGLDQVLKNVEAGQNRND